MSICLITYSWSSAFRRTCRPTGSIGWEGGWLRVGRAHPVHGAAVAAAELLQHLEVVQARADESPRRSRPNRPASVRTRPEHIPSYPVPAVPAHLLMRWGRRRPTAPEHISAQGCRRHVTGRSACRHNASFNQRPPPSRAHAAPTDHRRGAHGHATQLGQHVAKESHRRGAHLMLGGRRQAAGAEQAGAEERRWSRSRAARGSRGHSSANRQRAAHTAPAAAPAVSHRSLSHR